MGDSMQTGLSLTRRLQVAQRILATKLRFSIATTELFSRIEKIRGQLKLASSKTAAASHLMTAHRTTRSPKRQIKIEKILLKNDLLAKDIMTPLLPNSGAGRDFWDKRVIKMKEKKDDERGVLVVSFDVFGQMAAFYDMAAILRDYYFVLEPSWSGYCLPGVLQFLNHPNDRVIVQSPEKLDYDFLQRLNSNLIPIEIGASNWVDDRTFNDLGLKKEYDCVMVSHFGDLKRHFVLFDALRTINDPSFRVCLIGEPWGGRTREDLLDLARYYGVAQCLDIYQLVSAEEVNRLLNLSKVNILLSRKEGANRSIFEGLFANVPGIVLKSNCGVNKNYINEYSGRLIEDDGLAEALIWFRSNPTTIQPRKWALNNISCQISTRRLEEMLQGIAKDMGNKWTGKLTTKVNRPEFEYYDETLSKFDFEHYSLTRVHQAH